MFVNFVCRESKKLANGLCPIELSIIIDGKRRYLTLDRRIRAKSFDSKKQRVKGDKDTSDYLEAIRSKCYQVETEMIKAKMLITVDSFIEAYKHGVDSKNISLYGLFDEYIKRQFSKYEHGLITKMSLGKYKCTVRYCKEALPDKPLNEFTTADTELIYLQMLKSMTNNAAICYMRKLKTIIFFAIEEGYIERNPITYHFHMETFAYQDGDQIVVSGEGELQVYDILGRMVMKTNINGVETMYTSSLLVSIFSDWSGMKSVHRKSL
jgi:hypothetical protein